jgi:hypothetical protein
MRGVAFGVVLLVAVFVAKGYSAQLAPEFIPPEMRDGFTLALSVLIESIPFIILGIALSVLVQVSCPCGCASVFLSHSIGFPQEDLLV